ncbi:MAG: hypothetical protein H6729_02640 [Deltaproteobacteria bacterium]|nr:hypothetical protein [Deltaproteobacteria bacterium]
MGRSPQHEFHWVFFIDARRTAYGMAHSIAFIIVAFATIIGCRGDGALSNQDPDITPKADAATASAPFSLHLRGPGALVVENSTDAPIQLRRSIEIQRKTQDDWSTLPAELVFAEACPVPTAAAEGSLDCITLAPHGTARIVPWTGFFGCTQCAGCRKNIPAPPATYRFVVTTCDGAFAAPSPLAIVNTPGVIDGPPWAD